MIHCNSITVSLIQYCLLLNSRKYHKFTWSCHQEIALRIALVCPSVQLSACVLYAYLQLKNESIYTFRVEILMYTSAFYSVTLRWRVICQSGIIRHKSHSQVLAVRYEHYALSIFLKKFEDLILLKIQDCKNQMLYLSYTCFYISITSIETHGDIFGL